MLVRLSSDMGGNVGHRMKGKVVVVTGANTGIGRETARGLASMGATVVLACRDVDRGADARSDIVRTTGRGDVSVMPLDLGDARSVRVFAADLAARHGRLDVLVNNAGVLSRTRARTNDGFERTFGTNHIGTARLTMELAGLLERSAPSRVVVVSSKMHADGTMAWDDLELARTRYNAFVAYRQSKLANILFAKALARRLVSKKVTVNALHPGVVATELTRAYPRPLMAVAKLFMMKPAAGAACSIHVASAEDLVETTGRYFEESRVTAPSREALDEAAQEKLWALTTDLLAQGNAPGSARASA